MNFPGLSERLCLERPSIACLTPAAMQTPHLRPGLWDLLSCAAVGFAPSSRGPESTEWAALIQEEPAARGNVFRLQFPWLLGQLFLPDLPSEHFA